MLASRFKSKKKWFENCIIRPTRASFKDALFRAKSFGDVRFSEFICTFYLISIYSNLLRSGTNSGAYSGAYIAGPRGTPRHENDEKSRFTQRVIFKHIKITLCM